MIKISANGAQAEAQLKALEAKMEGFGKRITSLGNTLTKTLTLPLTALGGLSIKAADTQLKAEAKLLTALKQRTDVQQRLIAQAAELQKKTLFGDEEIINQQAYLAALGLTEQQIADTINAAVELSAALGMELDSAVKNLAKTYGGLTGELGESIPALKELTTEQLKQGAAVDYVNANYKGFADQLSKTGAGPLKQLKNKLGDMAEKLGTALLPIISKLADMIGKLADWFIRLSPGVQESIATAVALAAALGPVMSVVGKLATMLPLLRTSFMGLAPAIMAVVTALSAFASVGGYDATAAALDADRAREKSDKELNKEDLRRKAELRFANYDRAAIEREKTLLAEYREGLKAGRGVLPNEAQLKYAEQKAAEETLFYRPGKDTPGRGSWRVDDIDYLVIQEEALAAREKALQGVNDVIKEEEKSLGLIGEIQARIDKIQDSMPFLKTEEEIAAANDELVRLNNELERLTTLTNEVAPTATFTPAELITTSAPQWGIGPIVQTELDMSHMTSVWEKKREELARQADATAALSEEISNVLNAAFTNTAIAIGEGLGALITGEEFDPLKKILGIFGDLLKELGAALIAYSAALEAFKLAIRSMNPWVALGAGVALIAAGTAVAALANKPVKLARGGLAYGPTLAVVGDNAGAAHDPEVIAPLSKLREYVGGHRLELVGDVTFVLAGDTMRATLGRENIRLSTLG